MARTIDPNKITAKYQTAMAGAGQAYKDGIASVTESPMQKAADAEALYLQRVQEASASGKRKAALLAVPLQRWKDNASNVGATRLASGAQKAADKVRAHFQKWGPIYQQVSDTVAQMPKGGVAEAQARAAAAIQMLMAAAGRA